LAAILKAILILEKGVIPPTALLERVNPSIDLDLGCIDVGHPLHLLHYGTNPWNIAQFPTSSIVWPTNGLRRISVNSFGFGGTNGHVVMDDAYHFLRERALKCSHRTRINPSHQQKDQETLASNHGQYVDTKVSTGSVLLVWTGSDGVSLDRIISGYEPFYTSLMTRGPQHIERLAFTLAERRSHMAWRTFLVCDPLHADDKQSIQRRVPGIRVSENRKLVLIFTGQGAQYLQMGRGLTRYRIYRDTLSEIDKIYAALGCKWSIQGMIIPLITPHTRLYLLQY
jgi:acyl transferase domain-containing protein